MILLKENKLTRIVRFLVTLQFSFILFKENISSLFFIILTIAGIIYSVQARQKFINKELLFFTIPFFIVLIRCVFDPAPDALAPVKNTLFFLLFPFTFSLLPNEVFTGRKITFYLTVLKNCCAAVAIGYIILFLYYYDFKDFFIYKYKIPHFRDFVYNETPIFRIHPTYFTTITLFCTAHALEKFRLNRKKYLYELLYVALFVGITFLLLVKVNIILILLLLGYSILYRFKIKLVYKIAAFSLAAMVALVLALNVPGIKYRFTEIIESFNKPPQGAAHDSTNIRVAIINCSLELAENNYLCGVGFNNIDNSLNRCFEANYNTDFFVGKNYMSHNYYFYMFLGGGVMALAAFLLFTGMVIRLMLKINNFLLYIMIGSVLIISFTEDYFYRHFGLYYFCLIFFTFYKKYITAKPAASGPHSSVKSSNQKS
jgi:O-antigen ligase